SGEPVFTQALLKFFSNLKSVHFRPTMKLNKKYLFTTILVLTLLFFCVFFLLNHRNTRAIEVSLSDFLWPKGGMLFVMYHTVAEQENDLQGIHVQSTHDDISLHVQNGWFNMISPTK